MSPSSPRKTENPDVYAHGAGSSPQTPRPPRVVVAPGGSEPEEGLPLSLESSPGAPQPGSACSSPAHVPGGRNVMPYLVPGAAAPVTLQRVPETLGS